MNCHLTLIQQRKRDGSQPLPIGRPSLYLAFQLQGGHVDAVAKMAKSVIYLMGPS
jgi:hypothetical protein